MYQRSTRTLGRNSDETSTAHSVSHSMATTPSNGIALGSQMGRDLGEQLLLFAEPLSESLSEGAVVEFPATAQGSERA
jgi:hypothetical protein